MAAHRNITLDLHGCKTSYDMHLRIQSAFDFPHWYGKHWDAFRDLLYGCWYNTDVTVLGLSTLPQQTNQHVESLLEILEWNHREMLELKKIKPEFDCRFDYRVVD